MSEHKTLAEMQRNVFSGTWDVLVPEEGRTVGWIIESVLEDVAEWLRSDEVREVVGEAIVAYESGLEGLEDTTVDGYAKAATDALADLIDPPPELQPTTTAPSSDA